MSISTDPLVQFADLVYQGAFRLPNVLPTEPNGFGYGGTALAYYADHDSLFMCGYEALGHVAEFSIPAVQTGAVNTLARATLLQALTDPTEGRLSLINPSDPNQKLIGGVLPYSGHLYVSGYSYYDGAGTQVLSHFVSGLDLSTPSDVTGPFQVGGLVAGRNGAGFIAGYMGLVPSAWQTALGGPAFTGQSCLPIISRTSSGPALFTFDPATVGSTCPANAMMYYDINHPLGQYGTINPYYNGTTEVRGVVMPEGTRSVLFFGKHGATTYCYGEGTTNQALDHTVIPGTPGVLYCYDPEDPSKGTHGYPYRYQIWAYDANDLAAVKAGSMQPYDVRPYAIWEITFPYTAWTHHLNGAAYDPATGRLFLSQGFADGSVPVIHVYTVSVGSPPPPAPTPIIVTSALPFGTVGTAYAALLTGSSGTPPFTWTVAGLPAGLALSGATIIGTPTVAGQFSVSVTLTDSLATQAFKLCPLSIAAGPPPPPPPPQTMTIATRAPLVAGVVGTPYVATLATTNGTFSFTWTVASGLPPGLSVSGSTIAGTPTLAGVYPFTLSVTDSTSPTPQTATQAQSITVTPPPTPPPTIVITTTSPLASGIVGDSYTAALANTNGTGPFTWSVGSGLPPGLAVSGAIITGTLTVAGVYVFTLTVTDSATPAQVATTQLSMTVTSPPPPTPPSNTVQSAVATPVQWQLKVEDVPPDAFGGWSVQFYKSQGNRLSIKATAAPYVRSAIVNAGGYRPYAVWTKTGQTTVTRTSIIVTVSADPPPTIGAASSTTVQTVTVSPVKWNLVITDLPPDDTGGWSVQFYRNPDLKVGKSDSTSPYTRSVVMGAGTYEITAVWTKTGETPVTRTTLDMVLP